MVYKKRYPKFTMVAFQNAVFKIFFGIILYIVLVDIVIVSQFLSIISTLPPEMYLIIPLGSLFNFYTANTLTWLYCWIILAICMIFGWLFIAKD
jgi:hypothetical protein